MLYRDLVKKSFFSLSWILFFLAWATTSHSVSDPNAVVCVFSQYENGPENFHGCGEKFQQICKTMRPIGCAAALYAQGIHIMKSSNEAVIGGNHRRAHEGYWKAHHILKKSLEIWEVSITTGLSHLDASRRLELGENIKKELSKCRQLLRIYGIK